MTQKAIVLFSGGLDSTTTLAIAKNDGYELLAISFNYGQRHKIELEKAKIIAECTGIKEHLIVNIDLRQFGHSALTDYIDVPINREEQEMSISIPVTYVPARNTIFLSYALAYAEVKQCENIFLGVNTVDYSGYPDCRPEFYKSLLDSLKIGNWGGELISDYMPYIDYSKAAILKETLSMIKNLGFDYKTIYRNTNTSYSPDKDGVSPGNTGSDIERILAFNKLGLEDPIVYKEGWGSALKNAIKVEEDYKKEQNNS